MKKLFLLTSIFALAACGGGGGGGTGGTGGRVSTPLDVTLPDGVHAAISDDVQTSNGHVTSMKSEVLVASRGGRYQVIRSSQTPHVNDAGVTFISYMLDDVKLRPADKNVPENAYLQIGIDETTGQIDKMTMVMGVDSQGNDIGGALERVSDNTARFRGPIFEYVKDKYVFSVGTSDTAGMLNAVAAGAGFVSTGAEGSGWKQVGDVWKFDIDGTGNYAHWNPDGTGDEECAINNAITPLQNAVKKANHFDDGKWETVDGNYKYREYGDEAEYRVADNGLTKTQLDTIVSNNNLPALGHWNRVDEEMDVVSLGSAADLQYSDFGHFNPVYHEKKIDLTEKNGGGVWQVYDDVNGVKTQTEGEVEAKFANSKDYQLFAGGYAISGTSMVDSLAAPRSSTFNGNAIGRVYVSFQSNGVDRDGYLEDWDVPYDQKSDPGLANNDQYSNNAGHDIAQDFTTSNATLTVDANGKQTLNMPFADFYTVNVVRNGNTDSVTFAGTPTDAQYRVNDEPDGTADIAFKPGYYGVNVATEAAGTVYYKTEQDIGSGADAGKISREWEFQAAYGLKKQ